jgi:hypothetical protein
MKGINRRDFLKLGLLSAGVMAFRSGPHPYFAPNRDITDFEQGKRLGRVFDLVEVKSKPDPASATVKTLYEDNIIEWQRDVIGVPLTITPTNYRWVETPDGYVPATRVQPTMAILNQPLASLPQQKSDVGFWGEVTVPYLEMTLANPPARAPKLQELIAANQPFRAYYSQVFWVDDLKLDDNGNTLYHMVEKYGSYGDEFWADARGVKPLTAEDLAPIHPDVTDKKIVVDLSHQTLSCYEGKDEVLFTRVSTGAKYNSEGQIVDNWSTPVGDYHVINRKYASIHMAGGSAASGYELFAVNWTCIFATGGVALHSTFWHNNYGEPMSHGCVNIPPDEAKFVYRWSLPQVDYDDGHVEQLGYAGTNVQVIE